MHQQLAPEKGSTRLAGVAPGALVRLLSWTARTARATTNKDDVAEHGGVEANLD